MSHFYLALILGVAASACASTHTADDEGFAVDAAAVSADAGTRGTGGVSGACESAAARAARDCDPGQTVVHCDYVLIPLPPDCRSKIDTWMQCFATTEDSICGTDLLSACGAEVGPAYACISEYCADHPDASLCRN